MKQAFWYDKLLLTKGLSGWLILSDFISNKSLTTLPNPMVIITTIAQLIINKSKGLLNKYPDTNTAIAPSTKLWNLKILIIFLTTMNNC